MENTKEGSLRVWHIPNIPGSPFHVYVDAPQEAQRVLQLLAKYDIFQFENNIKPDFCNSGGLEVFEDGEWCEWLDPENGDEIDEWVDEKAATTERFGAECNSSELCAACLTAVTNIKDIYD